MTTGIIQGNVKALREELYEHDEEYKNACCTLEQQERLYTPDLPLSRVIENLMEVFADRPVLGQRKKQLRIDSYTNETVVDLLSGYETITYAQLSARYHLIANSWYSSLKTPWNPGDFIAGFGFTGIDYTSIDLAINHIGGVSVYLQTNASIQQITSILEETLPRIFVVGIEYLPLVYTALKEISSIERITVFDYDPRIDAQRQIYESFLERISVDHPDIAVYTYAQELTVGEGLPNAPAFIPSETENPLASLVYTSGSTGSPKGAMYTEKILRDLWLPVINTSRRSQSDREKIPVILLHFMPMSHMYGRRWLITGLQSGGIGYFATKSDMSTLFDDLALVRPTKIGLVPRICDMAYQNYLQELNRYPEDQRSQEEIIRTVKEKIRTKFFGGRVISTVSAGAPLSEEMKIFIESCLGIKVHDGYGSTETGAVTFDGQIQKDFVIDYRLVDVPELGYFSTDKPYPRGELYIKTKSTIPGYFKRPEITAAIFTDDGFYKSGDIMAEIAPAKLVYLDRTNNVLKLSQGEFVTISRVEAAFSTSEVISQIYVYGNSEQSFLLAVIVPHYSVLEEKGIIEEDEIKATIAESLREIAQRLGLNSYEIPRDFIIESEPFTQDNGLLAGIGKILRPNLKSKYSAALEALYRKIAAQQADKIAQLIAQQNSNSTCDIVSQAALVILGSSSNLIDPDVQFTDLGGDSLSAFSYATLLEEIFSVVVPVQIIISPTATITSIANYIDQQRSSGSQRPTFDSIHGPGATEVHASDMTLEKFINPEVISTAVSLPHVNDVHTVLITGANGWLGRFIALYWLEKLAPIGGRVMCIARGADDASARQRITSVFDAGDVELKKHFATLADHLDVYAGDIGEYRLGLHDDIWEHLTANVDMIVHVAAFVNHILPYSQLFGPNTVGTAELIRLAITTKIKPFIYASTAGVLRFCRSGIFTEDMDVRDAIPDVSIDNSYANGYAVSKWASEVLLHEAYDRLNLPITVFRCDMILAHRKYRGQVNIPDMFTRIIFSILLTGLAPASFYRPDATGSTKHAHYDGLPVDFLAEAIVVLGARDIHGARTYNMLNCHDDDISLDTFVDWLIQAGHTITRIDDYDQWYSRFQAALIGLPEKYKRHSVLPILRAYQHPAGIHAGETLLAQRFRSAVQDAGIGEDKDIPHLDSVLIHKYATDLKSLSLL